jgi:hypothetical protein
MRAFEPLSRKVERRLQVAARQLGARDPTAALSGLIQRTFPHPADHAGYGRNALAPGAAAFEPNFSELQPGALRFTLEPLPPEAGALDRRDEATREMRRMIGSFMGGDMLRWFDERSEPFRGFGAAGDLDYGAFFGASTDRDGLSATKVYYELDGRGVANLPPRLLSVAMAAMAALPGLEPLFTTLSALRHDGDQRITFQHREALRLTDLGPLMVQLGLGDRLSGLMQIIGLVLGGRFDLPAGATLLAFTRGHGGVEMELYINLAAVPDLPPQFLELLALGLSERPRELHALSRWMGAFTPEDDVWPGRFTILSVRTSAATPPRVSLYLRPAEFEIDPVRLRPAA